MAENQTLMAARAFGGFWPTAALPAWEYQSRRSRLRHQECSAPMRPKCLAMMSKTTADMMAAEAATCEDK